MTTVSNISIGARLAGGAAASARHGMNEAIARLSTGKRSMYGGDAGGQSMANNIKAKGLSYAVSARNAEDGISVAQTMESALMEIASLATRLRELAMQADNEEIMTTADLGALNKEATAVSTAIDAIVTDTWVSMGDESLKDPKKVFGKYQVDEKLLSKAADDAIFMHCLPAHRGEEVTKEVIDGPQSVVWDEAENRLHIQKAILSWAIADKLI